MSFHRHSPSMLGIAVAAMLGGLNQPAASSHVPGISIGSPNHEYRRGKGGQQAHRASGAAAIKRAARKRRNIRARASKRGAE